MSKFAITVAGETLAELKKNLADALGALGNDAQPAGKPSASKASATDAADDTPAPKASSRKPSPEKAKPAPAEDEDSDTLDYDSDVRPLVVKLSKAHGREAALEVISEFEDESGEACTKAQEVVEADWPELVKKVKAAQRRLDRAKQDAED